MPPLEQRIKKARLAVEAYRVAHTGLYFGGWYRGISEDHSPLLDTMKAALSKQEFESLWEFWKASDLLNVQELGFNSWEDFMVTASGADRIALRGMWR